MLTSYKRDGDNGVLERAVIGIDNTQASILNSILILSTTNNPEQCYPDL